MWWTKRYFDSGRAAPVKWTRGNEAALPSMKKNRRQRKRKVEQASSDSPSSWLESDGIHAFVAGVAPSPEAFEEASKRYQENIRKSPLWDEMVRQVGEKEAERMLLEFRVEVRR